MIRYQKLPQRAIMAAIAALLSLNIIASATIERFDVQHGPLALESTAGHEHYIEAVGEQAGMWGKTHTSLEAWAYPFKLVEDLTFEYSTDGGRTFRPLNDLIVRQTATPQMSQLHYKSQAFAITQTLFVPRNLPAVAILFDVDSSVDIEIAACFKVSLAPMLLSTKKKPDVKWDTDDKLLTAFETERKARMLAWSSQAKSHSTRSDLTEVIVLDTPKATAKKGFVPFVVTASWPGESPADKTLTTITSNMQKLYLEAMQHYREILDHAPVVKSPDKVINDAMAWSVISLHQLRVKNPFLGYGLVSGYSPSRGSTRPCYAWFFDEPTLTSWAYIPAGLASHVAESFEFLLRYQRDDGKMVHEITQSLPYHDSYFEKYMYAYIHASSGTYFLAACGNYYRRTGDIAFIKRNWPHLTKMLDWCMTAVDKEDGLLRIGEKQWGSSESSFAVGKDTQMEGMWLRALREMAYLGGVIKDGKLQRKCKTLAAKVSISIEEKFWDDDLSAYMWGLDRADRPLRSLVPHHCVSAWMGSLRGDRVEKMLQRMAHADCRSDWGLRSLPETDDRYDPKGYQTGSVWPVWNAGAIIADFRHNRQVDAFRNFRSMAQIRTIQTLGSMPEVLDGETCKLLEQAVPHQMFSETAMQSAFYDGLLGLDVDIPDAGIAVAPRIPCTWKDLSVTNIPVGNNRMDIRLSNVVGKYTIDFDLKTSTPFAADFAPLLPAGCTVTSVRFDGKGIKAKITTTRSAVSVRPDIDSVKGPHTIAIEYTGGYDFMTIDTDLEYDQSSRNLRLIDAEFADKTWRLTVQGLPGVEYPVIFRTSDKPRRITGGKLLKTGDKTLTISLSSPPDARKSSGGRVKWQAILSWK